MLICRKLVDFMVYYVIMYVNKWVEGKMPVKNCLCKICSILLMLALIAGGTLQASLASSVVLPWGDVLAVSAFAETEPETTTPAPTVTAEPETATPVPTVTAEPETTTTAPTVTAEPETTTSAPTATAELETTTPVPTATAEPETTTPVPTVTAEPETTTPVPTATAEPETTTSAPTATPEPETTMSAPTATAEPETTTTASTEAPYVPTFEFAKAAVTIGYKETIDGASLVHADPGYAGTITYSSSNPKVVRIDAASGKIYGAKKGSAEITAHDENGMSACCTVNVAKAPSKLTLDVATKTLGVGQAVFADVGFSSKAYSYNVRLSSSDSSVVRIEGMQLVAVAPGKAKITAKAYNGKKVSLTITVKPAPTGVEITSDFSVLGVGQNVQFAAKLNSGAAGTLVFSGDAPEIAEVRADGSVVPLAPGFVNIRVESHNGVYAECRVEIVPEPEAVVLSANYVDVGVKEKIAVPVEARQDNGAQGGLKYSSSNKKYVTVNAETGEITGVRKGSATITVTAYNGVSNSYDVQVFSAPGKISLNGPKTMGVGETAEFTVSGKNNARVGAYSIASSNAKVIRIDPETGAVEAVGEGKAKITAVSYNKKKATLTVTVKPAPDSVEFDREKYVIGVDEEIAISACINAGAAGSLTYCGESEYGFVTADGKAKGVAVGTFTATVQTHNGKTDSCEIEVCPAPEAIYLSADAIKLGVKESIQNAVVVSFDPGSAGSYTFESSNTKIFKVDAHTGKITGVKTGNAVLTVRAYNGVEACCKVTVQKAPSKVSLNVPMKRCSVGQTQQAGVKLSSNSCGAWTIRSSNKNVIVVEDGCVLRAVGVGSAKITVTTYNNRKSSVTVRVVEAPEKIWADTAELILPQGLQDQVKFSVPKGSYATFTYASTDTSIAQVDEHGCVSGVAPGKAEIIATTQNGLSASVQIEVTPEPEAIALGETSLTIGAGNYYMLEPMLLPENAIGSFAYASSDPKTVFVNAEGRIAGLKTGSAVITVTTYNGVSANLDVVVTDYYKVNSLSVIAHRGASGYYPENTLEALQQAKALGAHEVELDVRITKDGVLVCHHDATVLDGTKKKNINTLTFKQLQKIKPDICTFEEAMAMLSENDIKVLVEFKVSKIESKVLECVDAYDMTAMTRYASFKLDVLRNIHKLSSSAQTVYLINDAGKLKAFNAKPDNYTSTTVSVKLQLLSESTVRSLHLAGKQVIAWTANTSEAIQSARIMGVDGITTDYPDIV